MSRYVDLDGVTWDGKPISSKIREVKTIQGFMQIIPIGWLWDDGVPHIDLEKHDAKIRRQVVDELVAEVQKTVLLDWQKALIVTIAEQMKGMNNEISEQ